MSDKTIVVKVNGKQVSLTKKELELIYEIIELEKENLAATRVVQDSDKPSAYENKLNNLTRKLAVA